MSIEKSPGYKTSDEQWFADIGAAQRHELGVMLNVDAKAVLDAIWDQRAEVIAILRATGRKPRAPKPKLGRPRKAKTPPITAAEVPA